MIQHLKTISYYIFIFTIIYSCNNKNYSYSSNIEVIDLNKTQVILQLETSGKSESEAFYNLKMAALEKILYYGIPNTIFNKPLIEQNKSTIENTYPLYFNELYNRNYNNFIMKSEVKSVTKKNQLYTITSYLTINVISLKKDLEKNNIIKPFGI